MIPIKKFLTILVLVVVLLIFPNQSSLGVETTNSAKLFEINCAGCHPHGKNIIRRGKNLSLRALRRNKLDSLEAIAALVTNGKNNMSAYKDRLSEKEIQQVSAYVLQQAKTGWK